MNKGDFKPTREFQTLRSNIIAITKLGVKKFVFVKLPINLFKKLSKTVFTCPEEPRLNVLMERGNKSCDAVPLMFLITYEHSRTYKIYRTPVLKIVITYAKQIFVYGCVLKLMDPNHHCRGHMLPTCFARFNSHCPV